MKKKTCIMVVGVVAGLAVSGMAAASSLSYYQDKSGTTGQFHTYTENSQVKSDDHGLLNDKKTSMISPPATQMSINGSHAFNDSDFAKEGTDYPGLSSRNNKKVNSSGNGHGRGTSGDDNEKENKNFSEDGWSGFSHGRHSPFGTHGEGDDGAFCGGKGGGITPPASVVPVPAAVWLFVSGLIGMVGIGSRRGLNKS